MYLYLSAKLNITVNISSLNNNIQTVKADKMAFNFDFVALCSLKEKKRSCFMQLLGPKS